MSEEAERPYRFAELAQIARVADTLIKAKRKCPDMGRHDDEHEWSPRGEPWKKFWCVGRRPVGRPRKQPG